MSDFMPPLVAEIRADASQFIATTDRVNGAVRGMAEQTENSSRSAGQSMVGNFAVGGAIAGIMSSITSQVMSSMQQLASEAVTASDATDKFKATMDFAGVDSATIDEVSKSTRSYADKTVYDLKTIQNTTAQLAANSVPNYEKLTEAAGNLNAIAGGNKDTFASVGMVLTQTAGAGKLTTENWNQMANAIPGASGKLQDAMKAAGAYTGNFRDAMAEGQITSEEFNAAIMELGNEPVAVEAAKSTETFEGALGNLQATIVGSLSDALSQMKPMITDAIGGLSDILKGVGDGLKWMTDNANLSIPIIAGLGAVLLVALAPAIWGAVTATWAFTVALLANPLTWIAIGVGVLIAAIVLLAMNWDAVTKWIGDVWDGFLGWLHDTFEGLAGWWNDLWTGIGDAINDIWTGIVDWFTDAVQAVVDWVGDYWGLLLSFFIGPLGLVIQWVVENWSAISRFFQDTIRNIGKFFTDGFNAIGTFLSGVWTNIGNGIKNWWDGQVRFFSNLPSTIMGFFSGIGDWLYTAGRDLINGLFEGISSLAGSIGTFFLNLLPGWIKEPFKIALGIHSPSTVFSSFGKNIGEGLIGGIDSMMGRVVDASTNMSSAVSDNFNPAIGLNDSSGFFNNGSQMAITGSNNLLTPTNPTGNSSNVTQQSITVYAETNASPFQIASSVGWQLRMMG
jgi:tape measure domain-containing protein